MAQLLRPSTFEFDTLTGSTYEVVVFDHPDDNGFVGTLRRLPAKVAPADGGEPSQQMRRDEQVLLVRHFPSEVIPGAKPTFVLEGLGETPATWRRVSTVQAVRPL